MVLVASVCQPSTLRMLIWPEASKAQNNMAAVAADGSTVWVFIRRLNSSCRRSIAFVVLALRHWLWRKAREGEETVACLLQAVRHRFALEPPLAQEGLAASGDLRGRGSVDHVGVIGGDLVVQALGRVRQQVAMLVHGTSLHRHSLPDRGDGLLQPRRPVNDEELGPPQPTLDEVVEDRAPGFEIGRASCREGVKH